MMFLGGLAGVVYESVYRPHPEPTLLTLYGAMMGLSQADSGLSLLRKFLTLRYQSGGVRFSIGEMESHAPQYEIDDPVAKPPHVPIKDGKPATIVIPPPASPPRYEAEDFYE